METKLIHQIISRLAKENNIFPIFQRHYSPQKTIKYISSLNENDYMALGNLLSYSSELSNLIFYTKHGQKLSKYFNLLILFIAEKEVKQFLKQQLLEDKINNNLQHCLKNHPNTTLIEYVNYLKLNYLHIQTLIVRAFTWDSSNEGFDYWKNIHQLYLKFLNFHLKQILI